MVLGEAGVDQERLRHASKNIYQYLRWVSRSLSIETRNFAYSDSIAGRQRLYVYRVARNPLNIQCCEPQFPSFLALDFLFLLLLIFVIPPAFPISVTEIRSPNSTPLITATSAMASSHVPRILCASSYYVIALKRTEHDYLGVGTNPHIKRWHERKKYRGGGYH